MRMDREDEFEKRKRLIQSAAKQWRREKRRGRENSDLITMFGDEARVCRGEV